MDEKKNQISIKSKIKSATPEVVLNLYKKIKIKKLYKNDMLRFERNFGDKSCNDKSQLDAKLIFHAHAIEKGLSHLEFRNGFGLKALTALSITMKEYQRENFERTSSAYQNALSCLNAYKIKHLNSEVSLPPFFDELFANYLDEIDNADTDIGGYAILDKKKKNRNELKNFKELFSNRVSIREYSSKPVDIDLLKEAVNISMKVPSVCNRQSSRVRIITNKNLIEQALKIQGGYKGYDLPPVLLLVTTDSAAFLSHNERNQIYVDGGLFAMALLTSIEFVGLGACALNTMFDLNSEKNMRKLLTVPDNENFIMFISAGNFLDKTPYPKSFRYTGEQITTVLD